MNGLISSFLLIIVGIKILKYSSETLKGRIIGIIIIEKEVSQAYIDNHIARAPQPKYAETRWRLANKNASKLTGKFKITCRGFLIPFQDRRTEEEYQATCVQAKLPLVQNFLQLTAYPMEALLRFDGDQSIIISRTCFGSTYVNAGFKDLKKTINKMTLPPWARVSS